MALHRGVYLTGSLAAVLVAGNVIAQGFPAKPIRIVTAAAGGGVDFAARIIAHGISAPLGQQVIVENRGGNAAIAAEQVVKASPDGHTLLMYGSGFWLAPLLQDNVRYDPVRDFLPVILTNTAPNVLVVNPVLPVKSVKELIALARAKPEQLNYGTSGTGSSTHLASELFMSMTRVKIKRINYKGAAQALTDLVSGEIQLAFANAASGMPFITSGKLRALAVGSAERSVLVPGVPTVAEAGVPGYEAASINAMFAPAKTPAAVITRLNQEVVRVLAQADVKERLLGNGVEAGGGSPEQLEQKINGEITRMGKIIKEGNIRGE
jgi:tripartite-type tricarboxylate transporter receptor subunit TctC